MDRSLAPMRPSRALQETSHIVFVTSPRNLSREEGIIDNADVSLVSSVVRRVAGINVAVDPEIRFLQLMECYFSLLAEFIDSSTSLNSIFNRELRRSTFEKK